MMEQSQSDEQQSVDAESTQPLDDVIKQTRQEKARDLGIMDTVPLDELATVPLTEHVNKLRQTNGNGKQGTVDVRFGQNSDVGRVRKRNEDSCFSFLAQSQGDTPIIPFGLFLMADGMGGHVDGHEASRQVVHSVGHYVLERVYLPLLSGQSTQDSIQEIMSRAVELANRAIQKPDPEQEGGTTLTGAIIIGRRLYIVHVGDTRAYLYANNEFKQVTTDHTIVKRLEDAGHLTSEQAAVHPNRNLLYRAITGKELEEIDTYTRSLPAEGYLVLCSDGLWDYISDDAFQAIIDDDSIGLRERCKKMTHTALENGSTDNVSVILIQFKS